MITPNNRRWFILLAMCISIFAVAFTTTAVMNALPALSHSLHIAPNNLQWTINGYTLATASLIIVAGQLSDLFSRRLIFYIGALIFIIASCIIASSVNGFMVIAGRILQGMGAACITPTTLSIIKVNFTDKEEANTAIALWAGVISLGFALGPILGGIITSLFSWRLVFWLNILVLLIGAICFALTRSLHPTAPHTKTTIKLDIAGLILLVCSIAPFILGLVEGNVWGWTDSYTWILILGGLILFFIFCVVETKVHSPLIHFYHLKKRLFSAALLGQVLTMIGLINIMYFFNLYVQTQSLLNYTAIEAGIAFLPTSLMVFAMSFLSPIILRKVGARKALSCSFIFMAFGFYDLHHVNEATVYLDLLPGLLAIGVGLGVLFSSFVGVAMSAIDSKSAGEASGIFNTVMYFSGSIGTALGTIFYLQAGRESIANALLNLKGLSHHAKLLIDQAVIGHTLSMQSLFTEIKPEYQQQIMQLAKIAALSSFRAAMWFDCIAMIVGAILCATLLKHVKSITATH